MRCQCRWMSSAVQFWRDNIWNWVSSVNMWCTSARVRDIICARSSALLLVALTPTLLLCCSVAACYYCSMLRLLPPKKRPHTAHSSIDAHHPLRVMCVVFLFRLRCGHNGQLQGVPPKLLLSTGNARLYSLYARGVCCLGQTAVGGSAMKSLKVAPVTMTNCTYRQLVNLT
ncbi:hypothetical protein BZA77DRAFT_145377 [Pyronema omphalodes]|nr:hypothetical protein BZA77DRAFT_145377 [Pyronema omphalodes]